MEERSCRFHFGPLVLALLAGGVVLRHFAGCAHPMRHDWHHSHIAWAWRRHHPGCLTWAYPHPQGDEAAEKSEEAA